jgi:hypothetical protein
MAKKPLEIDMCAGSQLRDTQGEMLSVEGADISELKKFNDNHGKGFFNSIGIVTESKKIFKAEDCDNDRHKYYWEKIKAPYIYVRGFLHDDEDHPNARAAAAILRNLHKHDTPLQLKASVEGGVVSRGLKDPSLLARTKIHSVALTFTPANNATLVEPLSLDKSNIDQEADSLLIASVMHLAKTNVPSFRHIERDAGATKIQNNLEQLVKKMKSLGIEGNIKIPSKESIIQKAIEQKVQNNVAAIKQKIKELNKSDDDSDQGEPLKDCTSCGKKLTTKNAKFIGVQKLPEDMGYDLKLHNCPDCHSTVATKVMHEEVKKGVRDVLAAGALGAGLALSPASTGVEAPDAKPKLEQVAQKGKRLTDHRQAAKYLNSKYPILGAICNIESSNGTNLDHRTIEDVNSVHHGHTAGGICGMMPHTAAFILKKDRGLAKKYPELMSAAKDLPNQHRAFTDKLNSDPQAAVDFAVAYMKRNQGQTKNNHMLIYSWKNGLKGAWNKLHKGGMKGIEDHPYVQSVMKEYSKTTPQNDELKQPVMKALMAGYGGAGSPTGLVSGGVMQSESLDDGRSGFKYITCDNCGKEQVHAKYQVKCRDCGRNMSFEKLYNTLKKK